MPNPCLTSENAAQRNSRARIYGRLPLSALSVADSAVGLYRAIISRQRHIRWQLDVKPDRLSATAVFAAERDLRLLENLAARLVVNSPITHLRREFNKFSSLDDHLDRLFGDLRIRRRVGKPDPDPVVRAALRRAAESAQSARKSSTLWRFQQALATATDAGWFVFFDTLTVSPDQYWRVFSSGSLEFNRYIQRWRRAIGPAAGYRVRDSDGGGDFHRYFAVVESGDRTGRLHIHVVHMCRVLPAGVADPAAAGARHHRKVEFFRQFWHAGFSAPIAVRFGPSDAFGKIGWLWPNTEAGCPARVGTWQALAFYMAKYVGKSLTSTDRGDYKWRIRMSRGLGLESLRAALSELPAMRLLALALVLPPTEMDKRANPMVQIPPETMRREATREIVRRLLSERPARSARRLSVSRPSSSAFLRRRSTLRSLPELMPRPSLVMQLRDLTPATVDRSSRSIGSTTTPRFMNMAISDFRAAYNPPESFRRFVAAGGQTDA